MIKICYRYLPFSENIKQVSIRYRTGRHFLVQVSIRNSDHTIEWIKVTNAVYLLRKTSSRSALFLSSIQISIRRLWKFYHFAYVSIQHRIDQHFISQHTMIEQVSIRWLGNSYPTSHRSAFDIKEQVSIRRLRIFSRLHLGQHFSRSLEPSTHQGKTLPPLVSPRNTTLHACIRV